LIIVCLRALISKLKQVTVFRISKNNESKLTSSEVLEQSREQIEEKLIHMKLNGQDNGEKLWERCKIIINSIAEVVLGIMGPAHKGMWFDDE